VVLPVKGMPTVSGSPEAGEAGSHLKGRGRFSPDTAPRRLVLL